MSLALVNGELQRPRRLASDPRYLLQLFEEIERGGPLSQRDIATVMGISLGNANALVHAAVDRGYVLRSACSRYSLTRSGHHEMSRLRYDQMRKSIQGYKNTCRKLTDNLMSLAHQGVLRVVFYGAGDIADMAYGVMENLPLQLVAVVDNNHSGEGFHVLAIAPVQALRRLDYDRIVVTTTASAETIRARLGDLGVPISRLFFFH